MNIRSFFRRLASLAHGDQLAQDLHDEIAQHLEHKTAANLAAGMSPAEAREAARRHFGNALLAVEHSRDPWGFAWLESLGQDLRFALRILRGNPALTLTIVAVLALGIGGTTAIFSVVNAVILRPLPYPHPDQLIALFETTTQQHSAMEVAYGNYLDWKAQVRSFQSLAGYLPNDVTLHTDQSAYRASGIYVTGNFFATLGVSAALGRTLLPEDDQLSGQSVVFSDRMWRQRFGGDPGVLGKAIRIEDRSYVVVGILPRDFVYDATDVWLPLGNLANESFMTRRAAHVLRVIGRLKEGVTLPEALAEMQTVAARVHQQHPTEDKDHGVAALDLHEYLVGSSRRTLLVLLAAVGFILLVACANVANLLLARAAGRRKEISVRIALGAPRRRLVRQLLTESVLLATIGGACAVLLAGWLIAVLPAYLASFVAVPPIAIDRDLLLFAAAISIFAGLLFGIAPALQASQSDLNDGIKDATVSGPSRQRATRFIAVGEIALTLVLLISAGLLGKSFWRVLQVPPGFRSDHLLTMTVTLPESQYREKQAVLAFFDRLSARLQAMPGAQEAAAVSALPINSEGDSYGSVTVDGRPETAEGPVASFRRITPNYFRVMGIPLLAGRAFTSEDDGRLKVVIISRSMAREFWPNQNPLGQRIKVGPPAGEPSLTVVGVVGDVHNAGLDVEAVNATYEPEAQRTWSEMTFVVRTTDDPVSLAGTAQAIVREMDKEVVVFDAGSMEQRVTRSVAPRRVTALLLGIFASLALLLACLGIYGLIAYGVTQRTREIGIRLSLGAKREDVVRLILGDGIRLLLAGACLGALLTLMSVRLISSLLFGVTTTDAGTLLWVLGVLLVSVVAASYVPARRATRVDPMVALRYE